MIQLKFKFGMQDYYSAHLAHLAAVQQLSARSQYKVYWDPSLKYTYNYFVDEFVDMKKTEIKWTHETTLFLISEYQKRAQKFRNSKLKKKDLWQEISMAF